MNKLTTGIVAAAAAALFLSPVASLADAQAATITYNTALVQTGILASPGAYQATLALTTSPDGIVGGWYTPLYSGTPVPVTGGLHDGALWLDIGTNGQLHIDATMTGDGRLVGTAIESPGVMTIVGSIGPRTFDFEAAPVSSG